MKRDYRNWTDWYLRRLVTAGNTEARKGAKAELERRGRKLAIGGAC